MITEELEMGVHFATSDMKNISEQLLKLGVITEQEHDEVIGLTNKILKKTGFNI